MQLARTLESDGETQFADRLRKATLLVSAAPRHNSAVIFEGEAAKHLGDDLHGPYVKSVLQRR